ncbi:MULTISPECIES: SDR family NAD(P)-dependent oxidoreductase [unclassified Sphingomonas]|uniref:SDR family NAD(P)-dependent oxidoreductase n=1 Tax=unclassified Sphingomonas TaxID=196159 RepID=UPI00226A500F|nr:MULTISPECIES: SDR family NAD(P)-dependent oxidoreductase [unclassified Sphingomonas]
MIVGAGAGLSAMLARKLAGTGYAVVLAARDPGKLKPLAEETGGLAIGCDATSADDVARLFAEAEARLGVPAVVIFNAAARVMGPLAELEPETVQQVIVASAMGGFLTGQAAARAMAPRGSGTILFTGASASFKGYPNSAPFAMAKFALRGLAQSMARELGPQGIHVAHVMIDGAIRSAARPEPSDKPDSMLDSAAIAEAYLHLIAQPRSAWTFELDLRPWIERF